MAGVAAKVATWSPSSHGTPVAFPSHIWEKGVGSLLCEAPSGPFRQKTPDPFFPDGSPLDRLSGRSLGGRPADLDVSLAAGHFKLRPCLDAGVGRHANCFSLALISSLRIAPSIRRLVGFLSKAGGP